VNFVERSRVFSRRNGPPLSKATENFEFRSANSRENGRAAVRHGLEEKGSAFGDRGGETGCKVNPGLSPSPANLWRSSSTKKRQIVQLPD